MTREEEIHKIANSVNPIIGQNIDEDYICCDIRDFSIGFECGAKWADKNPKRYQQGELCDIQEEMMRQRDRRLIEKAIEWLKDNSDEYVEVVIKDNGYPKYVFTDSFEKAFKRAMVE